MEPGPPRGGAGYERAGLGELVAPPVPTAGAEHVYHLYVVRARDADGLAAALAEAGIRARLLQEAGPPPAGR